MNMLIRRLSKPSVRHKATAPWPKLPAPFSPPAVIQHNKTFTVDRSTEASCARADETAVALAWATAEQDRRVEYWTRQLEAPIRSLLSGRRKGRIAGHHSAAKPSAPSPPASGVAKLAALRAERDEAVMFLDNAVSGHLSRCGNWGERQLAGQRWTGRRLNVS